jgi:hypothetical protein
VLLQLQCFKEKEQRGGEKFHKSLDLINCKRHAIELRRKKTAILKHSILGFINMYDNIKG